MLSCAVLLKFAGPLLQHVGAGSAPSAPASTYTGGFMAALSPGAEPTLAVAFEAKGGLSDIKATATAAGMVVSWPRTLAHAVTQPCSKVVVQRQRPVRSAGLVHLKQEPRAASKGSNTGFCGMLTCTVVCWYCVLFVSPVVKALLGAGSREVLPYQGKEAQGPLTSVTPLVQVSYVSLADFFV